MSDASSLEFVDTNVLIYAHDVSAGEKHLLAGALLEELWRNGTGCLSTQVLQEFYVNVTGKVAAPLAAEIAAQIIADLSAWQVHQPGVEDVLDAIHIQGRHQVPFWDAMILSSVAALGCQTLWSEEFNEGQRYDSVSVQNPFAGTAPPPQ